MADGYLSYQKCEKRKKTERRKERRVKRDLSPALNKTGNNNLYIFGKIAFDTQRAHVDDGEEIIKKNQLINLS